MIKYLLLSICFFINMQLQAQSAKLNASLYDEHSSLQSRLAHEIIEEIQAEGDELILDIGCGNGLNTHKLSEKLASGYIIGIDSSPEMIDFSTNKQGSSKCYFQVKDFEEFDESNQYDVITAFSSLYCFKDPKESYRKIIKALKPGGKAYILTYPKEDPIWNTCYQSLSKQSDWKQYQSSSAFQRLMTVLEHKDYLNSLSVILEEFMDGKGVSIHPNIEEFKEYLTSWAPLFSSLPERELSLYVEQVTELSTPLFLPFSKGVEVPCRYLKIVLRKQS